MCDSYIRVGAGYEGSRPRVASRAGVGPRNLLDSHQRNHFDLKCGRGVKCKGNGSVQPQQVSVYGREKISPWPIPEDEP